MTGIFRRRHWPKRVGPYRSPLEKSVADDLAAQGVAFSYESKTVLYTRDRCRYIPDFILPNGILVEVKGEFRSADRQKHLMVKRQHPDLDIRFVFQNPHRRLSKQSQTTYALWCEKHGFLYAEKHIPPEWVEDKGIYP